MKSKIKKKDDKPLLYSTSETSPLKISIPEKNSSRVILEAHRMVGFFISRAEKPFRYSLIILTTSGLETSIVLVTYLLLSS
jgi:hypothetical protein